MADSNSDKARALKAEKQVERLERELELLKSRTKKSGTASPNAGFRESDKINFQLKEQVNDLKHQLKHYQSEHSKLQETFTTKTNEYEEKLKRMREIFGQASKNIDKYRATIASKDVDIDKLKAELQESQVQEHTYKELSETQQSTIEKLNTEIINAKTFYGSETKQLESKNRQLSTQLEQTKNDYEQYKKKARALLERNKEEKSNVTRLNELESLVEQLEAQKITYEAENQEQAEQRSLLEYDLRKTIDRIHELETTQSKLIKENDIKESKLDALEVSLNQQKEVFELENQELKAAYEELKTKYEAQIQELTVKVSEKEEKENDDNDSLDDLTQQLIQFKFRIHELEEANDSLEQQLTIKENEIAKLTSTSTSPSSSLSTLSPVTVDNNQTTTQNHDAYASMNSLLSSIASRQIPDERDDLEKQVERLSEMLSESEEKISALKSQEKILKDELRKMDAFDKRQNINVEYLKNVLISFLTSDNKQTMVPIISKLLYLDETETSKLMKNCM